VLTTCPSIFVPGVVTTTNIAVFNVSAVEVEIGRGIDIEVTIVCSTGMCGTTKGVCMGTGTAIALFNGSGIGHAIPASGRGIPEAAKGSGGTDVENCKMCKGDQASSGSSSFHSSNGSLSGSLGGSSSSWSSSGIPSGYSPHMVYHSNNGRSIKPNGVALLITALSFVTLLAHCAGRNSMCLAVS
jgi:hypothetical protein